MHILSFGPQTTGLNARAAARGVFNIPSIATPTYTLPGHESFSIIPNVLIQRGALSTTRPRIGNMAAGATAPFSAADYIGAGNFRIQGPKYSGPRIGTSISGATYALPGHENFQTSSVKLIATGALSTTRPRIGNIANGATVTWFIASDGYIPIRKEIARSAYLKIPYTFKTSLGTFEISGGDQEILLTSIQSAENFGTPQINQRVYLNSIPSAESFGTPNVVGIIKPSSIPSAESFGTPQVNQRVYLNTIPSAESFGTPLLTQFVQPSSIPSAESFGTPSVITEIIQPSSIPSAESFGTPQVNQRVYLNTIPSAESFGTPSVIGEIIQPGSIPSAESFGAPLAVLVVQPGSIPSAESFGTPQINQITYLDSIPSSESFGAPLITLVVQPGSIPSEESFGTPLIVLVVQPSSIPSDESFGAQVNQRIYLDTIPSEESFGTPTFVVMAPSSVHDRLIRPGIPRKRSSVGSAKLISASIPSSY